MTAWTSLYHVMTEAKKEFTPREQALYEFMVVFSQHEKEMLDKLVDWYPDSAKRLAKGIVKTQEMARLLR